MVTQGAGGQLEHNITSCDVVIYVCAKFVDTEEVVKSLSKEQEARLKLDMTTYIASVDACAKSE